MKKIAIVVLVLISFIEPARSQTDTIRILTTAQCETCKKAIEGDMSFEKGVKKSSLDLDTKILTVVYDSKKTNPEKIRVAVTKIGYDADSLTADPRSYKRLPDCCKKPVDGVPVKH